MSETMQQTATNTVEESKRDRGTTSQATRPAGPDLDSGNPQETKQPPPSILPSSSLTFEEPLESPKSESSTSPLSPLVPANMPPSRAPRAHSFPFALSTSRTMSFFQSRSKSNSATSPPGPLPPTSLKISDEQDPFSPTQGLMLSQATSIPSPSSATTSRPSYLRKAKRNSQGSGVMQCGRHSNDWLFGGVSIRETVKGIVRRDSEESER